MSLWICWPISPGPVRAERHRAQCGEEEALDRAGEAQCHVLAGHGHWEVEWEWWRKEAGFPRHTPSIPSQAPGNWCADRFAGEMLLSWRGQGKTCADSLVLLCTDLWQVLICKLILKPLVRQVTLELGTEKQPPSLSWAFFTSSIWTVYSEARDKKYL